MSTAARKIANRLRFTANSYHNGSLSYTQFGERNATLWREAERLGVVAAVQTDLRERPTTSAPHRPERRQRWRVWYMKGRYEAFMDVYASSEVEAEFAATRNGATGIFSANRRKEER